MTVSPLLIINMTNYTERKEFGNGYKCRHGARQNQSVDNCLKKIPSSFDRRWNKIIILLGRNDP